MSKHRRVDSKLKTSGLRWANERPVSRSHGGDGAGAGGGAGGASAGRPRVRGDDVRRRPGAEQAGVAQEQRHVHRVCRRLQRLGDARRQNTSRCILAIQHWLLLPKCFCVCQEEVLMVQEAKQDCYKKWYLPAGRVEVGESLQEALLREVKEEAGFECQPITLLLIQEQGPQWIRFIFLAKITGGSIKTLSAADQDSLQATWWDRRGPLPLRGRDILRLIDFGLKYRKDAWHPVTLPLDMSCHHVVQRLVLIFSADDNIWILVVKAPRPHLPIAAALKTHAVTWAANMVAQDAMPSTYYEHNVNTLGVFSLQHDGRQHGKTDGVCFNTLVALQPDRVARDEDGAKMPPPPAQMPPPVENPRYVWHRVLMPGVREKLLEKSKTANILPMHSLY